ncbi:MAG: hypothetical protein LBO79_10335 [Zoogloeaceae bacterium]|jgi:hypothetical protein|nr:hypothetical protein [Zoogloeaceae bacterium]
MMIFSENSEVSLVVTSCGRFDLLARALESFDRFNTAPVREVFITEDSGNAAVEACIPDSWRSHTTVFVNRPKLGQLASIDLAYEKVRTPWIFHCEDDWEFYRPGFLEESLSLLRADPRALQVWLRSLRHDLAQHSPYVFPGERQQLAGIPFYRVHSSKEDWQGFSLNPGLRRLSDYHAHAPFRQYAGEKALSKRYAEEGRYALILENDAVLHTGWGAHVTLQHERSRKRKARQRQRLKIAAALILGMGIGLILGTLF